MAETKYNVCDMVRTGSLTATVELILIRPDITRYRLEYPGGEVAWVDESDIDGPFVRTYKAGDRVRLVTGSRSILVPVGALGTVDRTWLDGYAITFDSGLDAGMSLAMSLEEVEPA